MLSSYVFFVFVVNDVVVVDVVVNRVYRELYLLLAILSRPF